MARVSTSSPRIMSMTWKFSDVTAPRLFFTPGMKRMGTGQTSSISTSRLPFASSSAPAGARTWGTSSRPTLEVIIPLARIMHTSAQPMPS